MTNLIDELYQIFPKAKSLPIQLDVCTHCCMSKEDHDQLRKMEQPEIPARLLYEYNCAAKKVDREDSDPEEFKHYLPRMLELLWADEELHHSKEVIFSRYNKLLVSDWSNRELELLQRFAQEYFVRNSSDAHSIIENFLMFFELPINSVNLLDISLGDLAVFPLHQFKQLLELEYDWPKQKLSNAFAKEYHNDKFNQWLRDANRLQCIRESIETQIFANRWDGELDQLYCWILILQEEAK